MILLMFILLYISFTFALKSAFFWRRTGINPITFRKKDDAHGFIGRMFVLVSVLTVGVVLIYALQHSWYRYLLPIWYLDYRIMKIIGWFLLGGSFFLIVIAQYQMSDSWRIGIDDHISTELVQEGLFRISRNPIYLGIILSNIGLFLVIPNAFILLTAVISIVCIHVQVRLEEEFLTEAFGIEYKTYTERVMRWY